MREPNIKESAFSCPHCGAYTTQYWFEIFERFIDGEKKTPALPDPEYEKRVTAMSELSDEVKVAVVSWAKKMRAKVIFPEEKGENVHLFKINNVFLSRCYNCKRYAVWVNEDMVYPPRKYGSLPNQDLSEEIRAVVEEARSILDLSPKGAAALLRLSVQMLCKALGEKGEDLNTDIANLVTNGLSPVISKSLDIVRVIGNESVHPGSIDLNDDKDIAFRIYDLVNMIAEQMISHPKNVGELYGKLPEAKRTAIELRDKKTLEKKD